MAVQRGRSQVRDAKNNEVHDVQNNDTQVCERQRVGELAVSQRPRPHVCDGRETVSAQCLLSAARTKLPDFFNILLVKQA